VSETFGGAKVSDDRPAKERNENPKSKNCPHKKERKRYTMTLYAVTDLEANTYKAWRMIEEGWELNANESIVTSLEGLSEWQVPPPPKSAQAILLDMRQLFTGQALPVQYEFRQVVAEVQAAAESENLPLMRYIIEQMDFSRAKTITPTQGETFRTLFLNCFA
jgi:hypothetical protein